MKKNAIEKQSKIFQFIQDHIQEHGYPPAIREICNALSIASTSTVHAHIKLLHAKGLLAKSPTKTRALKVQPIPKEFFTKNDELTQIPIIGKVSAGEPILAIENIEHTIPMSSFFTKNSECFMLVVKGDSMIEAGILNGDFVLVKKQSTAMNGDIVVALLEDEATVKSFEKRKDGIWLIPHHPKLFPFKVQNLLILGKVISVIRKY